jgi:hypothetical protein
MSIHTKLKQLIWDRGTVIFGFHHLLQSTTCWIIMIAVVSKLCMLVKEFMSSLKLYFSVQALAYSVQRKVIATDFNHHVFHWSVLIIQTWCSSAPVSRADSSADVVLLPYVPCPSPAEPIMSQDSIDPMMDTVARAPTTDIQLGMQRYGRRLRSAGRRVPYIRSSFLHDPAGRTCTWWCTWICPEPRHRQRLSLESSPTPGPPSLLEPPILPHRWPQNQKKRLDSRRDWTPRRPVSTGQPDVFWEGSRDKPETMTNNWISSLLMIDTGYIYNLKRSGNVSPN